MHPLFPRRAALALFLALACCASVPRFCPAATLTLTPTVLTNDWKGSLRMWVTGLPSAGLPIRLEKFQDSNNNGVVDAGEPLVLSFGVTDGALALVAGCTNLNVPGDDDAVANTQVDTHVAFPGLDSLFNLVAGNYVIRASSPANAFAPVTQRLEVRQKPQNQTVSGVVYSGTLANGVAYPMVVAFDAQFNVVSGVVGNAGGAYSLALPPGSYLIWAFARSYYGDQAGWSGTVSSGVTISSANIPLTSGTLPVAGKIKDSSSLVGLPAVPVIAYQSNRYCAATFADANGDYELRLNAARWRIGYEDGSMAMLGYTAAVGTPSLDVTVPVSGFDFSAPKVTAVIHGYVRDSGAPPSPLQQVVVRAENTRHSWRGVGMSYGADGRYSIGVTGDHWWVQPEPGSLALQGCLGSGTNWVLLAGNAMRLDFSARRATGHLVGSVRDQYNYPVYGAGLWATDASGQWVSQATADYQTGAFDIPVFAGTWKVGIDSDTAATWYIVSPQFSRTVADGQTVSGLLLRTTYAAGSGSGAVVDSSGAPLSGISIWATMSQGSTTYAAAAMTDASGNYWTPLLAGQWTFTANCAGADGVNFLGYECLTAMLRNVVANDANVLPTFTTQQFRPPSIGQVGVALNSRFSFPVSGPSNRVFQVLSSPDATAWTTVLATNATSGSFRYSTSLDGAGTSRSYRVLIQ